MTYILITFYLYSFHSCAKMMSILRMKIARRLLNPFFNVVHVFCLKQEV